MTDIDEAIIRNNEQLMENLRLSCAFWNEKGQPNVSTALFELIAALRVTNTSLMQAPGKTLKQLQQEKAAL